MKGELRILSADVKEDLRRFVDLPWSIHSPESPWVPPIRKDDASLLTPGRHPFWNRARRALFLAERDGVAVGRIAAVVDENYNDYARERCGAFGFFECRNDPDAANALFDAAASWLSEQDMAFMRGPLNPSTNHVCGMLVHGFDLAPAVMMPWNPPYYPELAEGWGLRKEQDLFAYHIKRDSLDLSNRLREEAARARAEGAFSCRCSGRTTLAEDVRIMMDIYRESWADNWGFAPLSAAETDALVRDLKLFLDPRYFVLFFHGDRPAAGMVALPDFAPLLKRLDGRIGITAPWHWWRARKDIRGRYRIILFGIRPEYRLRGLPLLLLHYLLERAAADPDFHMVEGSWVLEDNEAIDDLIEDFSGRIVKRYRIYRRDLDPRNGAGR